MADQTERDALTKAFGVSNGSHVWVEFQGGPDEMLAMLHAAGFRRIDPDDEALVERCATAIAASVGQVGPLAWAKQYARAALKEASRG